MPNPLHRKNAAEWVMWVCVLPLIAVVRIKDMIMSRR
jgi:hypothetical protein